MSYTPTTWVTGDTITATKLNKMENGIAGAGSVLVCDSSYSSTAGTYVLDKTVQEIYDALLAGTPVYIKYQYGALGVDFQGTIYLAPVIKIYNYNNLNVIRIVASKPDRIGAIGNLTNLLGSGVVIFSATGLNQYPSYYAGITTKPGSQETTGID